MDERALVSGLVVILVGLVLRNWGAVQRGLGVWAPLVVLIVTTLFGYGFARALGLSLGHGVVSIVILVVVGYFLGEIVRFFGRRAEEAAGRFVRGVSVIAVLVVGFLVFFFFARGNKELMGLLEGIIALAIFGFGISLIFRGGRGGGNNRRDGGRGGGRH